MPPNGWYLTHHILLSPLKPLMDLQSYPQS